MWLNYDWTKNNHLWWNMKRIFSLKKNKDFRKVYNKGLSVADRLLVVYKIPNKISDNRFGYSISKKIGNAVVRNRTKRIFREICRLHNNKLIQGFDIVIIARNPVKEKNYQEIKKSMFKLFKKCNLLKEEII